MEKKDIIVRLFAISLIVSSGAWATPPSSASSADTYSFLRAVVNNVLASNPEFEALKAKLEATQAKLGGTSLPLYNPTLDVEIEGADENNFSLGLTQALDWHDKQLGRQGVQQTELRIAEAELAHLSMNLASNMLTAVAAYYNALDVSELHEKRVMLLNQIVKIAEQRLAAGDINKSEVLLARLSLADAVIEQANQSTNVIQAQKTFYILSQQNIEPRSAFVMNVPDSIGNDTTVEALAGQHPLEQIALLQIEQSRQDVRLARSERRADPELGIKIGKDGEDALLGVQFSLPWQIRNNLSYTVNIAQKSQLQTEFLAQHTHRKIVAEIRAAKTQYQVIAKAWKLWMSNGESQLKEHIELLEQRWNSGELSTTDYLVQFEQNLHTQIAGVELKGNVWQTWFQWLNASAQVLTWLNLDNEHLTNGAQTTIGKANVYPK